jgi:protein-ribulosamine 3-kinase
VTDWQSLGATLTRQLQLPPGEARVTSMPGGDINQACRLEIGNKRFFVKLNRAVLLPMFDAEKAGLDAIRQSHTLRVPEVFMTGVEGEYAFIVMEFIDLGGQPDADRFAVALAAMHNSCNRQFGFHGDNTIGNTVQVNTFSDDWVDFWRRYRLGFQLDLARQNGLDARLIDAGHRLAEKLDSFFSTYQPLPSLLHGDLWSGNQGSDTDGNPVIYDPSCYYGDHEADLAMMELFGHPGERFFDAYTEAFPIDSGYSQRRELYNLYHILNHALLFGGAYAAQALGMTNDLLAEV